MPEELTNGRDICAIMVAYHPDAELPKRTERILREVGALVIVDNGSSDDELAMLRDLAANTSITLLLNMENLGIARALNLGIRRADSLGFKWALLLDQDTSIDEGMVRTLIATACAFPDRDRLAVIGSGYRDVNSPLQEDGDGQGGGGKEGEIGKEDETGKANDDGKWEEVESVITSGSLIALKTHVAVGAFREDFFIDYVDTEYCLRARAKGYRVIRTRKPIMSHAIGTISWHKVFGVKKWTFNHGADRRYYIARNDTVLLREFGDYVCGLWALKSFGRCVRLCKRIALYEDMKLEKIIAVGQGWWDGTRGHMGPRPHRRSRSPLLRERTKL
jgi:rhamnosyltransferase